MLIRLHWLLSFLFRWHAPLLLRQSSLILFLKNSYDKAVASIHTFNTSAASVQSALRDSSAIDYFRSLPSNERERDASSNIVSTVPVYVEKQQPIICRVAQRASGNGHYASHNEYIGANCSVAALRWYCFSTYVMVSNPFARSLLGN